MRRHPGRLAAPLLALLTVALCACDPVAEPDRGPVAELPPCEWAEVVSITDGDTIRVEIDGENVRVRYIGIDAPEMSPPGGKEPFAQEATDRNAQLVKGREVCLERDVSETDRFGRLLRHPWLADGRLVTEVLVAEGLANVVTFPPDVKYHESRLLPAQSEAQRARRGIWK